MSVREDLYLTKSKQSRIIHVDNQYHFRLVLLAKPCYAIVQNLDETIVKAVETAFNLDF